MMIKDLFTWYLINSHIWLNILKVDRHLFYFLLWMVATFGYKQKFPQKNSTASLCYVL
jgi:hypothetical protein